MILRYLARKWNRFFFEPQPPTAIAIFRILYGLLIIANLALTQPAWLTWYGPHAYMSMETMNRFAWGPRINLFVLLPQTDFAVNAFFWVFLLSAVFLTIGFMSHMSSVAVFIFLSSIQERNLFIIDGGDKLLRVVGFFLMFAPIGAALSVDRLLSVWKGQEDVQVKARAPWAQRMIQVQIAMGYLLTVWWKLTGRTWRNGTAAYYAFHLTGLRRFPIPFANSLLAAKIASWLTLAIEFSAGALVWFSGLRYPVLAAAVVLHMGIEYSLNIPLFEWVMVSTYVTFIYPQDLPRIWNWICGHLAPPAGCHPVVLYDGTSTRVVNATNVLKVLDTFRLLRFVESHSDDAAALCAAAGTPIPERSWELLAPQGIRSGFWALCAMAPYIPLLWPLAPLSLFDRNPRRSTAAIAVGR